MKLDFLIVGAMKAGTTTLSRYMETNPNIYIPENEVHFFNNSKNFKKGIPWYNQHFLVSPNYKIYGEKTPAYSYDPQCAERIYNYNKNIKLIWILREPTMRTYSNYSHCIMNGYEHLSFEDAISLNQEELNENIYRDYKRRSIYIEQINRFLKFFPIDNMHFIIFENFKRETKSELFRLSEFLGVKNEYKELSKSKRNPSFIPASSSLEFYTKKIFGNSVIWKAVHLINEKLGTPPPPLSLNTKKELQNYFLPYNKELKKVINQDLSLWEV